MEDLGICVTNPHTVHLTVFVHTKPFILAHKQCEHIAECVSTRGLRTGRTNAVCVWAGTIGERFALCSGESSVGGERAPVRFPYICRRAAVQTTGCLGGRSGPMSLSVESRAGTDTRPCRGNRSSPRSPGRSRCLLGFRSDPLKDTDRDTRLRHCALSHKCFFKDAIVVVLTFCKHLN